MRPELKVTLVNSIFHIDTLTNNPLPKDQLKAVKDELMARLPSMTFSDMYSMFKNGNDISTTLVAIYEEASFQEAVDTAEKIKAALGPEFTGLVKVDQETHKIEVIRR